MDDMAFRSTFFPVVSAGIKAARAELGYRRRLQGSRSGLAAERSFDFPAAGRYIISSENGVYHLAEGKMRQLTRIPTFGIAVADGNIYLATWYLGFSAIIVG
ncbi:MAG: hypothetical protein O2985_01465, partial [Proteobacteria bacterium]|nr:hypothetical protein [Pseudomonadota bacterium]